MLICIQPDTVIDIKATIPGSQKISWNAYWYPQLFNLQGVQGGFRGNPGWCERRPGGGFLGRNIHLLRVVALMKVPKFNAPCVPLIFVNYFC